tara:strand:+ start:716 stop:940 length:225 start_codon:yes stop_codon:yes gene_type:complete
LYITKLYRKKRLKNEVNIKIEKTIILVCEFKITSIELDGINPPEDISVIDKFREIKDLKSKILRIIKIKSVKKL